MNSNGLARTKRFIISSTFPGSIDPANERHFHCSFRQENIERGECILADSPTGRFIRVDTQLCELLGFPRNALLAISLRQLLIDTGYTTTLPPERLLLAGEIDGFAVERLLVRSDGTTILTTLNCRELAHNNQHALDHALNPPPTMGSIQPITGEPTPVPQIQELPLPVGSFLSGGIADFISRQWSDHTGVAGNDLLGLRWLSTIHPDDRIHWQALFDGTAEDATVFDCRICSVDGRYCWFQVNILLNSSLPDEGGRWTATCTPVEERRRNEIQAATIATAASNLFRAEGTLEILTSASDAIATALADWCRIDMVDSEETLAETIVAHHDPIRQQTIRHLTVPQMDYATLTGVRSRIPISAAVPSPSTDPDDEEEPAASSLKFASLISVPIVLNGEIFGYIYAGTDDQGMELQVSDMQCIKQIASMTASRLDLAHRITRLGDDHAAKDRFIAVLGHEIRTPLAAVQTALEIAADTPLPEQAQTSLEIAQRNISLEISLLNDLLDVTRLRDDKLRLDLTVVDLHRLLRDVLGICRLNAHGKPLHFQMELHAMQYHVAGDQTRLHQVFWNLLKNAITHTEPGKQILIRTKNHQGQLVVEVEDTGIGLAANELGMLQEIFEHRMDRWPAISDGLGLGLSICASLVKIHHGSIEVESKGTGTGTTFTVTLPTMEQPPTSDDITPTETPDGDVHRSGKRRILLVDDHVDMITVYRQLLQQHGYEVAVAYTMREALELGREGSFDLLISDIGLPDGDGIELMERLTRHGPIAGIAVSGYGTRDDIQRSLAAGYALHLVKPFSVRSLCDAIERIIDSDGK